MKLWKIGEQKFRRAVCGDTLMLPYCLMQTALYEVMIEGIMGSFRVT